MEVQIGDTIKIVLITQDNVKRTFNGEIMDSSLMDHYHFEDYTFVASHLVDRSKKTMIMFPGNSIVCNGTDIEKKVFWATGSVIGIHGSIFVHRIKRVITEKKSMGIGSFIKVAKLNRIKLNRIKKRICLFPHF